MNYNDDINLEIEKNAPYQAISKRQKEQEIEMETLRDKLLADIYGLPMTYNEMTDYINEQFAKIK